MSQEVPSYSSKEGARKRRDIRQMPERRTGKRPKEIIEKNYSTDEAQSSTHVLDTNRTKAVTLLTQFLDTPEEQELFAKKTRSHQGDVISGIRDYFASGETAGTIKIPTGAGKTVVAAAVIKALDMNTVFVSPTGTILDQTKKTIEAISPHSRVSNYDGRSKNLAGNVINTTPSSLKTLAEIDAIAQGTELLVIDEIHFGALGEQRHALWRKFPNALILGLTATDDFPQLDELIERGLVDPDERWVGAFRNRIFEMSPEEAWERGAITPLDISLIKTTSSVGDIHITQRGNYNEQQLEQALNTAARNYAAIGIIAGLDTLPEGITLPDELRKELQREHELIKGKQIVVFGLSVKHIEWLAAELLQRGIAAAEVHGKLRDKENSRRMEAHRTGELQILVAKDLLRLGFDSPATEVGLFLDGTQSPNRLMQEVGRLMRLSEETGKERARAIQFVDSYSDRRQRPLLIPELFDTELMEEAVSHRSGGTRGVSGRRDVAEALPVLTVEGLAFDAFIEDVANERGLAERFDHATLDELDTLLNELLTQVNDGSEGVSIYEKYQKLADKLPRRMGYNAQQKAIEGVASSDEVTVQKGERALLLLTMPHILEAIEPYLSDNPTETDEFIQAAVVSVYERIGAITDLSPKKQIQKLIVDGDAIALIAKEYGMPVGWVKQKKHVKLSQESEKLAEQYPRGMNEEQIQTVAHSFGEAHGLAPKFLKDYLAEQLPLVPEDDSSDTFDVLSQGLLQADLARALNSLSEREADILSRKYGLFDGTSHTLDAIATHHSISRERVRQIQTKALSKLRHGSRAKNLRPYLD